MIDKEAIADFLKALGHPTRLAIVELLAEDKKCVGLLTELIAGQQANISQHLALLKAANIVGCSQEGNRKCYFLTNQKLIQELLALLKQQ